MEVVGAAETLSETKQIENGAVTAVRSSKRRRNMFDVPPEEVGVEKSTDPAFEWPSEDSGEGILLLGPSAGGKVPKTGDFRKYLPALAAAGEEALAKAKRFVIEKTLIDVLQKPHLATSDPMGALNDTNQRQRALASLSRIYIGNINFDLKEEMVKSVFEPFGNILKIDMTQDQVTLKHKGFAFIEYDLPDAAQLALEQMHNTFLGGRNIKVGRPSNIPQDARWIERVLAEAAKHGRIYIANVHVNVCAADLKSVFEAFGKVLGCELISSPGSATHRGYGFIEYESPQVATDAVQAMHMFDLGGQALRVRRAVTPPASFYSQDTLPTATALAAAMVSAKLQVQEALSFGSPLSITIPSAVVIPTTVSQLPLAALSLSTSVPSILPAPSPVTNPQKEAGSGMSTQPTTTPVSAASSTAPKPNADPASALYSPNQSPLATTSDEDTQPTRSPSPDIIPDNKTSLLNQGMSVTSQRYAMMQNRVLSFKSPVVVLRNMVSAEDVDDDLEGEVQDECSKYGLVKSVIIYKEKESEDDDAITVVKIFVEFGDGSEAEKAKSALNGRYFGGQCISAEHYDEVKFYSGDLSG